MKKKLFALLCALSFGIVCLTFSGCSIISSITDDEFAQQDYDNDEKIASSDRSQAVGFLNQTSNGKYKGGFNKFFGRKTIVDFNSKNDKEVSVELSLYTEKGKVKVVFVDAERNVTTLLEYEGGETDGQESKEISTAVNFLKGKNRFKIVGYDCEDLTVELHYN